MKQIFIIFFCLVSFQAMTQEISFLKAGSSPDDMMILSDSLVQVWFQEWEQAKQDEFEARLKIALDKYIQHCVTDTLQTTLDQIWSNPPPGYFQSWSDTILFTKNPSMSGFLEWLQTKG